MNSSSSSSQTHNERDFMDIEWQKQMSHENHEFSQEKPSSENDNLVKIGKSWISKDDIIQAFGGTLNPGYSQPPSRKFANPAPLGLCAFGLTTFVLSLTNVQARGVTEAKVVVGLSFFYGGFVQLCAGMWEMVLENTFGATALSSFGGFWLAFGAIETDAFGITSAYTNSNELNNALAFFLFAWFIFTFLLVLCTLRSTLAFFLLFFFLDITFLLLAIGHLYPTVQGGPSIPITKAGGYFGIFAAFAAWYNAFAGLATRENSLFIIKPVPMPWSKDFMKKSE
ncbi:putative membrane protein [Dipodascopsis uninucleata]